MGNSMIKDENFDIQKSITTKLKTKNNLDNEKMILSNHHVKSSTLGTIKQSSTKILMTKKLYQKIIH